MTLPLLLQPYNHHTQSRSSQPFLTRTAGVLKYRIRQSKQSWCELMLALDLGRLEPSYVDCKGTDKDAEDNERSR